VYNIERLDREFADLICFHCGDDFDVTPRPRFAIVDSTGGRVNVNSEVGEFFDKSGVIAVFVRH